MVPLPNRPLSSLLMRSGGSLALFDCGEGTQVQMRKFHWGFRRLDVIFLTHLHADHVAGLPGLFHTVANSGRTEPMHIYGPPGTLPVVAGLRVIAAKLPYEIVVNEVTDGDRFDLPNGVRGQAREADHQVICLAYRIDVDRAPAFDPVKAKAIGIPRVHWSTLQRGEPIEVDGEIVLADAVLGAQRKGLSLAFLTDSRASESLKAFISGVDLLVSEATYATDEDEADAARHGHMTIGQACAQARAANVGRLWLTHFSGRIGNPHDHQVAARAIFGPTDIGEPGLSARLSFNQGYERLDEGSRIP
jgi:ribonuclease Z